MAPASEALSTRAFLKVMVGFLNAWANRFCNAAQPESAKALIATSGRMRVVKNLRAFIFMVDLDGDLRKQFKNVKSLNV